MRVFVAGAGGAIGRRLVPQLVAAGHEVVATTQRREKVQEVCALGAHGVVMDGLDAGSVGEAVARAEPEAVIHQMTALPISPDLRHFDREFARTNELRTRGTDHLLAAGGAVGVRRFVAQSFTGWPNQRSGGSVKTEDDPLESDPPGQRASLEAIRYLERAVLNAAPIEGVVLRYGTFYGPGTGFAEAIPALIRKRKLPLVGEGAAVWSFVHIDDAAAATVATLERGTPGIYNIVDDDPAPVAEWLPYLADQLGARPPRRVPAWLARLAIGAAGVALMTKIRGASNAKAKRELRWEPRRPSWRDGFRDELGTREGGSNDVSQSA